jgi:hypothetical protein
MATPPKLSNILGTVENIADRIGQTIPVIRSTVESVSTIAQGKRPEPSPAQQPATTQELVPRNVGQIDEHFAAGSVSGFLILGGLALLAVLFFGVKR